MPLLGYLITIHAYGTWLHGRSVGSVDFDHNIPGTLYVPPNREPEQRERDSLKYPPNEFDAQRRFIIDSTIKEVCAYRKWQLHAVHARSTHAHAAVQAKHTPERVMNDLKGYSTRRMREAGILALDIEPWSYHGSTRYLNTANSLAKAIDYVLNQQGDPLEMRCPSGWTPRA